MPRRAPDRTNARAWRVFVVVLMLALTVPRLWQRGMFLDGVTYAVVARNMAVGVGSLWAPSFSATTYQQFFEQPPLGFALQAVAFAAFGDHFAVERAYSVALFLVNGWLIALIWRRLLRPEYDWLPVLLWLTPSVVTWAVINNMLENTQAVFTSAACYLVLWSADVRASLSAAALGALAALAIVAAVLVKGPVGLFPLALPLLVLIAPRDRRPQKPAAVWGSAAMVLAVAALWLWTYQPSRTAIDGFIDSHLAPALAGERGTGPRAADIARHLTLGIGLRMAVVAGLFWAARRFRARLTTGREAAFFFATACAASVPILTSPVLAGHYFYPSTAFFALAFGALALPAIETTGADGREPGVVGRVLPWAMATVLAVAAIGVIAVRGSLEPRDLSMVRSLDAVRAIAPVVRTIGACPSSGEDWGLQSYLQRFYRISLDTSESAARDWFLVTPGACQPPPGCQPAADTERFALLRCPASAAPAVGGTSARRGVPAPRP